MKKYQILLASFLLAFLTYLSCQSPKIDVKAEADAIMNLENQWTDALQSGDVDKIMSFFDSSAVSMPSNKPIISGLQAIRARTELNFADTALNYKTYTCEIDIVEVSASGDLAYSRGHDQIEMKTKDGITLEKGKFVDLWKKINGEWKAIVFIGNSDNPAEGQ